MNLATLGSDTLVGHGTLAEALLSAQDAAAAMRDAGRLTALALEVIERTIQMGCRVVVAASRTAEPLVAAALVLADGRIEAKSVLESHSGRVALIEVGSVTGIKVKESADQLHARGAQEVFALIAGRTRSWTDQLDELSILSGLCEIAIPGL